MGKYKAGVLFGEDLKALYQDAKDNQFAMPAVNTTGTDTINATLEAAAAVNSPVIIQFSNGGAQFIAGKGMPNDKLQANISGAISGALHIHTGMPKALRRSKRGAGYTLRAKRMLCRATSRKKRVCSGS
jgi:fructose-bisphosphate aldolase class II